MGLWLLRRAEDEGADYDEADGFVVRASSERQARRIVAHIPTEAEPFYEHFYGDEGPDVWLDPHRTTCVRLHASGPSEVILRDFRAG